MPGAACMAATAALRAGIGTLKVLCPASAAAGLCALPEAMLAPVSYTHLDVYKRQM